MPVAVDQRASAKIQVLDLPVALPHKCASCGVSHNADGRVFLDFRIHIDFYGEVYICSECIVPLMNDIGWISPEQRDAIKEENVQLKQENTIMRGKVVSYGMALRQFIDNDELELIGGVSADSETSAKDDRKAKPASKKSGPDDVSSAVGSFDDLGLKP